jgi:hypothetical protein
MSDTLRDCARRDRRTLEASSTLASWRRLEDHARWAMLEAEAVHSTQAREVPRVNVKRGPFARLRKASR